MPAQSRIAGFILIKYRSCISDEVKNETKIYLNLIWPLGVERNVINNRMFNSFGVNCGNLFMSLAENALEC